MNRYFVHSSLLEGGESRGCVRIGRGIAMEFHVSRRARKKYDFKEDLFATTGNVVFHNFHAVRLFAQKINETIDLIRYPERAVRTGQLNAMGLIDEILHYVVELYRQQTGLEPFRDLEERLRSKLGNSYTETLVRFVEEFPPKAVYAGGLAAEHYLAAETRGVSNGAVALEELLLLWLANVNPAFDPFKELFDDANLKRESSYKGLISELTDYFNTLPPFGPENQTLVEMLRSPAVAHPDSLSDQLKYMRERWGMLLGKYLFQLLSGLDLIREEDKLRLVGPGPTEAYTYTGLEGEHESFSADREWMPKVVLIAKSSLVWLDQLSKKYNRAIEQLDQIPDEELDLLRDQGFTALWLIGLWERSPASKRIKQLCGNPEAEASAYSLLSYDIAASLGGWQALQNLRERCWYRGIRLASDMVPNHTGVDSEWVLNRPERFIQLPYPPFPSYTYGGENLSSRQGIGIYLEDHYFEKSDAAVTFKRVDFNTGDTRYIYHGNDGTHMPWNDTAQLNFADPQVREAVIDTILHVARNFPIIRFDAAMTLAKKHIQRLWYPEPGSGGDIPSRAEHAMTKEEFDRAIPKEFWREVVDRVASEQPDTLLLAEAFWMMEGYFVRTLGMHRVYNSAFMNMLKEQENAKYRSTIRNTLEFDPEILKRFVNFMNNPDEETAARQFGKGDKYFGVCTMLVTMPGLPMFGHGQIWGFEEKYGMEYRRAQWDEQIDVDFVARHEREIFPLMKRRHLFAEVVNFCLFDLYTGDGAVNEDVFAYSNRTGNESGLVFYNNRYERSVGWINRSAAALMKDADGSRHLAQTDLAAALALHDDPRYFTIFREHTSGLFYLRNSHDIAEHGFYVELDGYQNQVFLDFHEVVDNELGHYRRLEETLAGRGIRSIDAGLKSIFLEPVHRGFSALVNAEFLRALFSDSFDPLSVEERASQFARAGAEFSNGSYSEGIPREMLRGVEAVRSVNALRANAANDGYRGYFEYGFQLNPGAHFVLAVWALLKPIGRILDGGELSGAGSLIDEWLLDDILRPVLEACDTPIRTLPATIDLIKLLAAHQDWYANVEKDGDLSVSMERLLEDETVRRWLGENRYKGTLWFNRESYLELIWWLFMAGMVEIHEKTEEGAPREKRGRELFEVSKKLLDAMEKSRYQVELLVGNLRRPRPGKKKKKPDGSPTKPDS